jgi:hypothetical protein
MLQFSTSNRHTALGFLRTLYPSRSITDSPECAKALLDLVEADIIRITDPAYHAGQVVPGQKWDSDRAAEVQSICLQFHKNIGIE